MNDTGIFSPRILIAWIAVVAAMFALSLYLATKDEPAVDTIGPNAQSTSAIGYAGFAGLLRRRGLEVEAASSTRNASAEMPPPHLRIVTEPRVQAEAEGERLGPFGGTVVLMLPKWIGTPDTDHKGWIGKALEIGAGSVEWALARSGTTGRMVRTPPLEWWTTNALGVGPSFDADMQLISNSDLRPLVAFGALVLVGERWDRGTRIIVVADPDALSNHGLFAGDNARFATALIDYARSGLSRVVFDDRVRGRTAPNIDGNLLRRILQPPFLAVMGSVLAALAVLLTATMGRFGRPEPLAPLLAAGKHELVANAARMVAFSPHRGVILERYTEGTMRAVARHYHAPSGLVGPSLVEWLGRIGRARGVAGDIVALAGEARTLGGDHRADAPQLVGLARRVHRWRKDMLDAR